MATVNELVTALGFELSPNAKATLDRYQSQINTVKNVFGEVGKNAKALFSEVMDVAGRSKDMEVLAKATRMSTDELQRWQRVAEVSGVSADKLFSQLKTWAKNTAITKQHIFEWADTLKNANKDEAERFRQEILLGDDDLFHMFSKGSAYIDRIMHSVDPIPEQQLREMERLNDAYSSIKGSVGKIYDKLMIGIGVKILKPLEAVKEFAETEQGEETIATGFTLASIWGAIKGIKWIKPVLAKAAAAGGAATAGGAAGGTATAAGAGTAAASGAATIGLGGVLFGIAALKSVWDLLGFGYSATTKGWDEALKMHSEVGDDWMSRTNIINLTAAGTNKAIEGLTSFFSSSTPTSQDNRTITNNIYVSTPEQARQIIGEMGGLQSSTPGGMSSTVQ